MKENNENVELNEKDRRMSKIIASTGLSLSLLAVGLSSYAAFSRLHNGEKENSYLQEMYDELENRGVSQVTEDIAIMPEAFTPDEMRDMYGLNDKEDHYIRTDDYGQRVVNLSFDDNCTYYRIPKGYKLYFVEQNENIPGMYGILKAADKNSDGVYQSYSYAEIPNEYSLDGAIAVYYPYLALINEKDRLLSLGRELDNSEQEIIKDAWETEKEISGIYRDLKSNHKSL